MEFNLAPSFNLEKSRSMIVLNTIFQILHQFRSMPSSLHDDLLPRMVPLHFLELSKAHKIKNMNQVSIAKAQTNGSWAR